MNNSSLDAGIPVLTEIISTPSPASASEIKNTEPVQAPPAPEHQEHTAMTELEARLRSDSEKWEHLERELGERILHQVLERVDAILEERIRDSLADVLQVAVDRLAHDIRGGLQHTLKDVINHATSQEIAKLHSSKN